MFRPRTSISRCSWPSFPNPTGNALLALIYQFEQSERLRPEELLVRTNQQLGQVIAHAYRTVPFYRDRLEAIGLPNRRVIDASLWRKMPLLSRRDIQLGKDALRSTNIPPEHGPLTEHSTSGSSGQPVIVLGTAVTRLLWDAFTLRDHLWHRRDFSGTLATVRYFPPGSSQPPHGSELDSWGATTDDVVRTGPCVTLNITATIGEQLAWLERHTPTYLLTYPSNAMALLRALGKDAEALRRLKELRTFGELVDPALVAECNERLGVPVVDVYSSQEVGYIAMQCPVSRQYHVQSEGVMVEVIDDDGNPCSVGETGRVVITTLQNFAMPLIRYDIGDFAEVGDFCPCGRSLPTLRRIVGRQRNMLRMPDGQLKWPSFGQGSGLDDLPPVFQFQVIQSALDKLIVNVVRPAPFTASEEEIVRLYLSETLGYPFAVDFRYLPHIPRSAGGKFEDFRCDIPAVTGT